MTKLQLATEYNTFVMLRDGNPGAVLTYAMLRTLRAADIAQMLKMLRA